MQQAFDTPRHGAEFAWIVFGAALALGLLEIVLARVCSHADLRDTPPTLAKGAA